MPDRFVSPRGLASVCLASLSLALVAGTSHAQEQGHIHAEDSRSGLNGSLGPYPMGREASGTSWQPQVLGMAGPHASDGDWTIMVHGHANLVYDYQGGRRGDQKAFASSMLMLKGQRPLGEGTWALRSMWSGDSLMGGRGYPLLFQTGETADGSTPLVDRQHPHEVLVELATSYSRPVGSSGSVFGYAALAGEPALGPTAFMHRVSGMVIPEAPLSHHWLDSTHISFGVATVGATAGRWKFESSVFNGREPDHQRDDIDLHRMDAVSGRVSFNPNHNWSAQASFGYLPSPDRLAPGEGVHRSTASLTHAVRCGAGVASTTLAVGVNRAHGETQPAWLLESMSRCGSQEVFARAEWLANDHLVGTGPLAGREFDIGKLTVGGAYRIHRAAPLSLWLGALGSVYSMPGELEAEYGSGPASFMLYLRAAIE